MRKASSYCSMAARGALAVLLLLPLASCDNFFGLGQKPPRQRSVTQVPETETYMTHLALARISLASAKDTAAANTSLDIVQAYHSKPAKGKKSARRTRPEPKISLVLFYKNSGSRALQEIAVPVGPSQKKKEFPSLLQVLGSLNASGSTLYDIKLLKVMVTPDYTLKLADSEADETRAALEQLHSQLTGTSESLTTVESARKELELIRFFITHRFRDAAYLTVDNVKRELAKASQSKPDDGDIKNLSKQLDALEGELHRALPFTLSFRLFLPPLQS